MPPTSHLAGLLALAAVTAACGVAPEPSAAAHKTAASSNASASVAPPPPSGTETSLARVGVGYIRSLTLAGNELVWAHAVDREKAVNRVVVTPTSGGPGRVLSAGCGEFSHDLVIADGAVFFVEFVELEGQQRQRLTSIPLAGGAPKARGFEVFPLAATSDGVVAEDGGALTLVPGRAQEPRVLSRDKDEDRTIARSTVAAVAGGRIWMRTIGDYRTPVRILSVDLAGGELREEYRPEAGVEIGDLRASADTLYWTESSPADPQAEQLRSRPLAGGAPATLLTRRSAEDERRQAMVGMLVVGGDIFWREVFGRPQAPIYRLRRGAKEPEQLAKDSSTDPVVLDGALFYGRDVGVHGEGGEIVRYQL